MIKITFPFSNCSFVVDSPVIIESHIFEKFLLFAEFIKVVDDKIQSIVIRVNKYDISIYNKKTGKIHIIRCDSVCRKSHHKRWLICLKYDIIEAEKDRR